MPRTQGIGVGVGEVSGQVQGGRLSRRNRVQRDRTRGRGCPVGTATPNSCVTTRPSGSAAETVTVAVPFALAATVRVSAATATPATAVSEAEAAKARMSPSGSLKWGEEERRMRAVSTVSGGILRSTSGARFGTVTANVCTAERPSGSVAVMVRVASPLASAVTATVRRPRRPGHDGVRNRCRVHQGVTVRVREVGGHIQPRVLAGGDGVGRNLAHRERFPVGYGHHEDLHGGEILRIGGGHGHGCTPLATAATFRSSPATESLATAVSETVAAKLKGRRRGR